MSAVTRTSIFFGGSFGSVTKTVRGSQNFIPTKPQKESVHASVVWLLETTDLSRDRAQCACMVDCGTK